MNILLTGATGYIGKRLLPVLIEQGHHVICCVREKSRFNPPASLRPHISVVTVDLLKKETLNNIPTEIDVAYYLVHSMTNNKDYAELEKQSAVHFREQLNRTKVNQLIYLSGIVNEDKLSDHLNSRLTVEHELEKGNYHFTCLRAGIIIGSGSASFEIMRDLVEKLPIMIAPKWLSTKCQPIGVGDVISFLSKSAGEEKVYDQNFDIGCNDILSYKDMLLQLAEVRQLKRRIYTVPIMTPRLSSYWLYIVTSTSYRLAQSLVDSMKIEVVCRDTNINEILGVRPISYKATLYKAFEKLQTGVVLSSWKDAHSSSGFKMEISELIQVPEYGCFQDKRTRTYKTRKNTVDRIWKIGGKNGWYYGNWLWRIRGFLDKLVGGVGLRRGRTNKNTISPGDSLDFWRVLYANREEGRLLLFAEMKLPGEAWLEFKIENETLVQTATFRPKGILGRLYWYSVLPFHGFIFKGMARKLAS